MPQNRINAVLDARARVKVNTQKSTSRKDFLVLFYTVWKRSYAQVLNVTDNSTAGEDVCDCR